MVDLQSHPIREMRFFPTWNPTPIQGIPVVLYWWLAGKKGICEACFESGLHVVSTEKSQRQSARGSQCMVRRWFSNHPNGFGSYLLRKFAVSCKTCKPSPLPSKTCPNGSVSWAHMLEAPCKENKKSKPQGSPKGRSPYVSKGFRSKGECDSRHGLLPFDVSFEQPCTSPLF